MNQQYCIVIFNVEHEPIYYNAIYGVYGTYDSIELAEKTAEKLFDTHKFSCFYSYVVFPLSLAYYNFEGVIK